MGGKRKMKMKMTRKMTRMEVVMMIKLDDKSGIGI
jgi:hypothetical protein